MLCLPLITEYVKGVFICSGCSPRAALPVCTLDLHISSYVWLAEVVSGNWGLMGQGSS